MWSQTAVIYLEQMFVTRVWLISWFCVTHCLCRESFALIKSFLYFLKAKIMERFYCTTILKLVSSNTWITNNTVYNICYKPGICHTDVWELSDLQWNTDPGLSYHGFSHHICFVSKQQISVPNEITLIDIRHSNIFISHTL